MTTSPKTTSKNNVKGTTIALIIMAILDIAFTVAMIFLFYLYQSVPDSLIVAVFGVTFGECGFCTLIYKIKKGVNVDGIHGQELLGEAEAICDSRYEEQQDSGFVDGSSGVHREQQRKFGFDGTVQ